MPLPRNLAVFNKSVTNRLLLPLAGWAPGFAIVYHVGRNTGQRYRTPVNIFHHDGAYVIALTYGEGSWVRNVVAAGGCSIRTRRRIVRLIEPRLYTDPERRAIPIPVRWILDLIDVDEFLALREP